MQELDPAQNVVVFGESGVGKSSIINLVAGSEVAKTSPDADACTTRVQQHDVIINGKKYKLWDTVGLDGGSFGRFRAAFAEKSLKMFLQSHNRKNELSLLIYCVRASRATRALVRHYRSVRSATRESHAPMVIIVTGLENAHEDMENWWHRNAAQLSDHGMEFVDHACITSIEDNPDDPVLARARRAYSQDAVRNLISRNCIPREQYENGPHFTARRRTEPRRWRWVAWTYLVSALLSS